MTEVLGAANEAAPAAGRSTPDSHVAARPVPDRTPGVRPWVRTFVRQWIERSRPRRSANAVVWKLVPVGAQASRAFGIEHADDATPPSGLLIWLGDDADESIARDLLAACRMAWDAPAISRLAICHAGAPVAGLARSIAIEARFASVTAIERPPGPPDTSLLDGELAQVEAGFAEVRFDHRGRRFEPVLVLHTPDFKRSARLDRRDVVLVTGGSRGIGAECALRLADRTGAALLLAGRSSPQDAAVAATLQRAAALGLRCRYLVADVTDAAQLTAAVAAATEFGPVTAVLHAAGVNEPMMFENLSEAALLRAMAAKTTGLRAAIAAAGPQLRRIIAFGSILACMGLKGQAHYALANAWQTAIADQYARSHDDCDVLVLEWSIWCGDGLRHRAGSLNYLARFGVDAIALDDGLAAFERLAIPGAVGTMIVTSRFGPPREVSLAPAKLPACRFIDNVLVHYPGLELVVETAIPGNDDPCRSTDRGAAGDTGLPRLAGLGAMAQIAAALAGTSKAPHIAAVRFGRAIAATRGGAKRVIIAALADENGRVDVVLRTADDGFAGNCIECTFAWRDDR